MLVRSKLASSCRLIVVVVVVDEENNCAGTVCATPDMKRKIKMHVQLSVLMKLCGLTH